MGILETAADLFRFSKTSGLSLSTANTGIASSFDNSLGVLVGPPTNGSVLPEVAQALSVPAVARAVQLYLTAAAKLDLLDPSGTPCPWLAPETGAHTPGERVAAMVQSLLFYGRAVLFVTRDAAGEIVSAVVLPPVIFSLDIFGRTCIKGEPAKDQDQFVYIKSLLGAGFLEFGRDSITHYLGLRDSILARSRNPIPVVELKVKDQFEVTTAEIAKAQTDWQTARSSENGAVAITPYGVDVIVHGAAADTAMLSEARNAVRLDVANYLNINASLLDGNNGTSDTYSNTLGNKDEFLDLSLDTFLVPIEQRLSKPDVSAGLVFDRSPLADVAPPAVGNTGNAGGAEVPAVAKPGNPGDTPDPGTTTPGQSVTQKISP